MIRYAVLLLAPLLLLGQSSNQAEVKPYEDSEAYNVYSAVLALENPKGDLLIVDTTVPFTHCLEPRSDQVVDAAIEDYRKANKSKWRLGYHLGLERSYTLVSQDEAGDLLQSPPKRGAWRFSAFGGIHHFSAVGFSPDKTIAFVEMDVVCGGLCGHGGPFILQKKKGKWVQYVPNPPMTQNPDGTRAQSGPTICSWFY